ncbi:MAG TPA: IclR family transcriptional regulator [Lapillicoccus sp.]|nr:IclR family transcriptional regulator [Lapillicoccus sp.]
MAADGGRRVRPASAPPQYPIESVDNALRLLLLFAEHPRIRLTDASSYLGVASSTAHRLLAMLQYRGFVRQEMPSRAYVPGGALGTIAAAVVRQSNVPALARPVLEHLNRELGETVHLGRLDGDQVRYLDAIESGQAVRVASRVGRLVPAHCTSTGKAMLSSLPVDVVHALYPQETLDGVTSRSIRERRVLDRQLRTARQRGYAVSDGESEDGVVSVAVPVTGSDGALYGLNVSVPAQRMSPAMRRRVVSALLGARTDLGSQLD